jgi:hypothetical protein
MKKFDCTPYLFFAFLLIFSGCAKNEESLSVPITSASDDYVTIDNQPTPKPGVEPSDPVPAPAEATDQPEIHKSFVAIENPTKAYLSETCLFDISKMELGALYHQVNNKNINIGFFWLFGGATRVQRFHNSATPSWGWDTHWGYSPYVESERPDVLFSEDDQYLVLAFSKPCIEFGVEVSPNIHYAAQLFNANFGDFIFDSSSGHVSQRLKTPSGARLFAVKSTKPFSVVAISFAFEHGSPDFISTPSGYAIANIRYKLAK